MAVMDDCTKCLKVVCLGMRSNSSSGNMKVKQLLIVQWLVTAVLLYLWIHFNGGLLPSVFKSSDKKLAVLAASDVLGHFDSEVTGDGLKVSWAHAVNNKRKLKQVLRSDAMMVEGDVILKGQGTSLQQLVPVMAHPPDTDSDITLDEWLKMLQGAQKGIKLDFKSMESVDLTLEMLSKRTPLHSVPIHLSAEVAEGPNNFMAPNKLLDPVRFIKQCTSAFPKKTLALGWTNGWSEEGEQLYSWAMVKEMYDIVEAQDINQPLTYNTRAKLAKNSITQLKWLTEMTDASLTLFSPQSDNLSENDILNIRHRFAKDKVFYDVPEIIKEELEKVPQDGGKDERLKFQVSQWRAIHSKDGEKIYLGSEALVFQNGLLTSKEEHKPDDSRPEIEIEGRVEFLGIPTVSDDNADEPPVGLGVYVRVSQSSQASVISGIRCFISVSGHLEISTQSVPGVDKKMSDEVPGTLPCFKFHITDSPDTETITLRVSRLKTCNDVVPQPDEENQVELEFSMEDIHIDSYYMGLRAPSSQAFVVVDEFIIR